MKGWLVPILCLAAIDVSSPALACTRSDVVVAVDVGHSSSSPGAVSARGVPEFRFNRELADVIVKALASAGFRNSFAINADGRIKSLRERTTEAAQSGADLLLSVHHDSVQPRYLSSWTFEGVTRRHGDRFRGFSLFVSAKNAQFDASRNLAELIGRALLIQGLIPTLHHAEPIPGEGRPLLDPSVGLYRYDDLVVLKEAAMPAVLLEAGVIVNREEELLLAQRDYRKRIAQAIVSAVAEVCGGG